MLHEVQLRQLLSLKRGYIKGKRDKNHDNENLCVYEHTHTYNSERINYVNKERDNKLVY